MKARRFNSALFVIFLIAIILRLIGIRWGLPNSHHYFSYHPDEILIIGAASNVDIFHLHLDTKFYNYGSLYIFIVSLLNTLALAWGLINGGPAYISLANMILVGRIASAVMGGATVLIVYQIAKNLYNEDVAKASAFLLAIAPLHMVHSHYTAVDVPTTFFLTLSFLFSVLLLNKGKDIYFLWGGLFAGFATATKYNALLISLPLFYLLFKKGFSYKRLFLLGFGIVAGFIVGCPGSILNYPKFKNDFLYELRHTRLGHGDLFVNTGPGWLYNLRTLFFTLGIPLFLALVLGLLVALISHSQGDLLIFSFLIPYYLLISFSNVRFARYLIPLLPFIIIFASRPFFPAKKNLFREIAIFTFILISIYTSLLSVAYLRSLTGSDPRDLAGDWLRSNLRRGDRVGLLQLPWFYSPAFIPYNGGKMSERDFHEWALKSPYKFSVIGWDRAKLLEERPDYFIVSNFEFLHPLRLRRPSAVEFWRELEARYKLEKVFKRELRFLGISFPFIPQMIPEDVLYTFPEIRIYKIKT
jgi:4-amino-4-deoxy-L-arabinose transferase-like glycosyltransferase